MSEFNRNPYEDQSKKKNFGEEVLASLDTLEKEAKDKENNKVVNDRQVAKGDNVETTDSGAKIVRFGDGDTSTQPRDIGGAVEKFASPTMKGIATLRAMQNLPQNIATSQQDVEDTSAIGNTESVDQKKWEKAKATAKVVSDPIMIGSNVTEGAAYVGGKLAKGAKGVETAGKVAKGAKAVGKVATGISLVADVATVGEAIADMNTTPGLTEGYVSQHTRDAKTVGAAAAGTAAVGTGAALLSGAGVGGAVTATLASTGAVGAATAGGAAVAGGAGMLGTLGAVSAALGPVGWAALGLGAAALALKKN